MRRFFLMVLVVAVVAAGCGGGGSGSTGTATDAEWGVAAQPTANRIVNTYEQLGEQLASGEGLGPIQERCEALADAARDGLALPPLPSGGEAQAHLTSGLNMLVEGAETCSTGTAADLLVAADQLEAGFDELQANVGAFDLS